MCSAAIIPGGRQARQGICPPTIGVIAEQEQRPKKQPETTLRPRTIPVENPRGSGAEPKKGTGTFFPELSSSIPSPLRRPRAAAQESKPLPESDRRDSCFVLSASRALRQAPVRLRCHLHNLWSPLETASICVDLEEPPCLRPAVAGRPRIENESLHAFAPPRLRVYASTRLRHDSPSSHSNIRCRPPRRKRRHTRKRNVHLRVRRSGQTPVVK